MLLNYLYANFLEEHQFADSIGVTVDDLAALIDAKVFPAASYRYESSAKVISFLGEFRDDRPYRFHLKGHAAWYRDAHDLGLTDEARARAHFFMQYDASRHAFSCSAFYQQLSPFLPDLLSRFDEDHADATWRYFLDGVYGVCTRDGRPGSVFLKQIGVMIIDHLIADGPKALCNEKRLLLRKIVDRLDTVASDFAPHEVARSSRQRCIINARKEFLE